MYIYIYIYVYIYMYIYVHIIPTCVHTYIQTIHYITLHYNTIQYNTMQYVQNKTVHYITLHYITYTLYVEFCIVTFQRFLQARFVISLQALERTTLMTFEACSGEGESGKHMVKAVP